MFGEYLQNLLKEKGIIIKTLVGQLGLKSRESIYRIFRNQYSVEKTTELTYKIMGIVPFTEEEKNNLLDMLKFYKPEKRIIQKEETSVLNRLYYGTEIMDTLEKSNCEKWFHNVLEKNKDKRITIYIGKNNFIESGDILSEFFKNYPSANINVYHNIMFNTSDKEIERQIYIIARLAYDSRYIGIKRKRNRGSGIFGFIEYEKRYKMFFIDENNEYAESSISHKMYTLMTKNHEKYIEGKRDIRDMYNHLSDYSTLLSNFNCGETNDSLFVTGDICFGGVPGYIKYALMRDANYFNLGGPDNDFIRMIEKAINERDYLFFNSTSSKKQIFDENMMIDFFEKRTCSDTPIGFRELTNEEIQATLERNFSGRRKLEYRFFKKKYTALRINIGYIEDAAAFFFDNSNRFDNDFFYIAIDDPSVMKVIKNFLYNLWDKNTLSEEESKAKLEELAQKYLNDENKEEEDETENVHEEIILSEAL